MSTCRSCGCPIIWAVTPNGKKIPLDARAPTFVLDRNGEKTDGIPQALSGKMDDRGLRAYVSHFSTCPGATKHSKTKAAQSSLLPPEPPAGHWEE